MRTRLALALALSHNAELLLLDEPSSGLDPAFRRALLEYLSGLIQGGTVSVLFSTHITSDLDRIADFVTFLRRGKLVFSTTREDMLDRWYLIRGGRELMEEGVSSLFAGMVVGEYGVEGLTEHLGALRERVPLDEVVVEKATLEDVVYYTGRTGKEGLNLHAHSL
jgi:ABC-2 type transport system ATP-binding protein